MPRWLDTLRRWADDASIPLDEAACERFTVYSRLLLDWNTRVNLTAIKTPDEVVVKHFIDSLTVLTAVDPQPAASLLDVGTGAGFPGVPLLIARPDLALTLLDSLQKRLVFLEALLSELGLTARFIHGRAEEVARTHLREGFDLVTSRAVADLPLLCELCLPFVRPGGAFVAMLGAESDAPARARGAIHLLAGRMEASHQFHLPDGAARMLLPIKKISQTPAKYPRAFAKMTKSPLR